MPTTFCFHGEIRKLHVIIFLLKNSILAGAIIVNCKIIKNINFSSRTHLQNTVSFESVKKQKTNEVNLVAPVKMSI